MQPLLKYQELKREIKNPLFSDSCIAIMVQLVHLLQKNCCRRRRAIIAPEVIHGLDNPAHTVFWQLGCFRSGVHSGLTSILTVTRMLEPEPFLPPGLGVVFSKTWILASSRINRIAISTPPTAPSEQGRVLATRRKGNTALSKKSGCVKACEPGPQCCSNPPCFTGVSLFIHAVT